MEIDFYIKLTLAVYRVTELFPEQAALKRDIRDLVNKILADLLTNQAKNGSRLINDLKNLFDLAEVENWVDSRNLSVLRREYNKIEELVGTGKTVEKPLTTQERKEMILGVLKEKKMVRAKEFIQNFPQISKRTIIRDIEELYRSGAVVRVGNGRASCYNIKS